MRALLLSALLATFAPGCCCTPACSPDAESPPARYGPGCPGPRLAACRSAYTPGYRRPCYPAYRPIDSAYTP